MLKRNTKEFRLLRIARRPSVAIILLALWVLLGHDALMTTDAHAPSSHNHSMSPDTDSSELSITHGPVSQELISFRHAIHTCFVTMSASLDGEWLQLHHGKIAVQTELCGDTGQPFHVFFHSSAGLSGSNQLRLSVLRL